MSETTVLIAEHDSLWIDWAMACRKPEHSLLLLVQSAKESQSEFFDRVARRFDHIRHERSGVDRVVLASGSRWDGPKLLARARMVRHLLSRLAHGAHPAPIVLDAGTKDGPASLGMAAIADALNECVSTAPSQLRLASGPMDALQVA